MEPILVTFWTNFEPLLGPILEPKSAPEGDQNGTSFGTTSPRLSGVRNLRFQELYERRRKAIGIRIILSQRKGGIWRSQTRRGGILGPAGGTDGDTKKVRTKLLMGAIFELR